MQQAGTAVVKLDDMEFGRRLAAEREVERGTINGGEPGSQISTMNAVWDEGGNFIIYPSSSSSSILQLSIL